MEESHRPGEVEKLIYIELQITESENLPAIRTDSSLIITLQETANRVKNQFI